MVPNLTLNKEEDTLGYWRLLVELWRRHDFILVVAGGVKVLNKGISFSKLQVRRQLCLVRLKRHIVKKEREKLD
ncbi:hypothetical protein AB1303_14865 [Saccharolobus solfataricus]|uniref:Uncharacterized protein n=1 Tax=Saccharolobus solfataricus TaxID=2287 RepID=A0A7S9IGB5_SACSO|nr:hypothetical protein [Saccharolobus solfataricus]QPG48603.1 hypothetical protein HFC64_00095 [Saccharolobus solfataricus]